MPDSKPVCGGKNLKAPQDISSCLWKACPADGLQDGRSPLEGGYRCMLDFIAFSLIHVW